VISSTTKFFYAIKNKTIPLKNKFLENSTLATPRRETYHHLAVERCSTVLWAHPAPEVSILSSPLLPPSPPSKTIFLPLLPPIASLNRNPSPSAPRSNPGCLPLLLLLVPGARLSFFCGSIWCTSSAAVGEFLPSFFSLACCAAAWNG
jgi:hypothetical protein